MKRLFIGLAMVVASLSFTSPANADAYPANNAQACADEGGVFTQTGTGNDKVNYCTVAGSSHTVVTKDVGQEGGKAFTLTTTTQGVVYSKDAGILNTQYVGTNSTTCTNPGGDEVPTYIKPCQP